MKSKLVNLLFLLLAVVFGPGIASAEEGIHRLNMVFSLRPNTPPFVPRPAANVQVNYLIVETGDGGTKVTSGAVVSNDDGDAFLTYDIGSGNTVRVFIFDPLGAQDCKIPGDSNADVADLGCKKLLGGFLAAYTYTAERATKEKPLLLPMIKFATLSVVDPSEGLDVNVSPDLSTPAPVPYILEGSGVIIDKPEHVIDEYGSWQDGADHTNPDYGTLLTTDSDRILNQLLELYGFAR